MKILFPLSLRLLLAGSLGAPLALAENKESLVTSVHSQTFNGYKRAKAKDGKYKTEYFAISNGGALSGTMRDSSVEKVQFTQLSGVLHQFLAKQEYRLARDSKSADLLILVNWGQTTPRVDPQYATAMNELSAATTAATFDQMSERWAQANRGESVNLNAPVTVTPEMEDALISLKMFDQMRDQANLGNARLLGYAEELVKIDGVRRDLAGGGDYHRDLISDLEEPRYYLIISAYDFRELVENKKQKLQWVTRVSIRAPGSAFDNDFAAMLAKAARHFGQDSGGLLRRYDPRGRVDIGDIEVIEMSAAKPTASSETKR